MQGKILIVDSISTNRIVLKVKLASAFYQVLQASTMAEALHSIAAHKPDLVLTAINLPDGNAAQLCQTLSTARQTSILPVLVISGEVDTQTRLDALRAGAFDVMSKPVNETLLLGRIRTMIRSHQRLAEWQIRDDTSCALGLAEPAAEFSRPGSITLVGMDIAPLQHWVRKMAPHLRARYTVSTLHDAMAGLHAGKPPDAVVLCLPDATSEAEECLRLIPALRASGQTRNAALLVIQNIPAPARATSALDVGADDVMTDGFDAVEACLRLQALLGRKHQVAQMLANVRTGLREVVNDPLTNLYNRRFAIPYMNQLIERSKTSQSPFAVILADMDHFKRINDKYGHASGDAVLVETADRLRAVVRTGDMVARIGGEEFLIAMPATTITTARAIADLICESIGARPFTIPGSTAPVCATISLGLTSNIPAMQLARRSMETAESLVDRADKALYAAKLKGRNCVGLKQPESRPAA
ncbi:MAG: diguanylate cyclase [Sulfitobacter sp.]